MDFTRTAPKPRKTSIKAATKSAPSAGTGSMRTKDAAAIAKAAKKGSAKRPSAKKGNGKKVVKKGKVPEVKLPLSAQAVSKRLSIAPQKLTPKQSAYLQGQAHHVEPTVQVGKDGITEGLVLAIDASLWAHELIKVRVPQMDREEKLALADELASKGAASLVATLGRNVILYRRHPNKPKYTLPKPGSSASQGLTQGDSLVEHDDSSIEEDEHEDS